MHGLLSRVPLYSTGQDINFLLDKTSQLNICRLFYAIKTLHQGPMSHDTSKITKHGTSGDLNYGENEYLQALMN